MTFYCKRSCKLQCSYMHVVHCFAFRTQINKTLKVVPKNFVAITVGPGGSQCIIRNVHMRRCCRRVDAGQNISSNGTSTKQSAKRVHTTSQSEANRNISFFWCNHFFLLHKKTESDVAICLAKQKIKICVSNCGIHTVHVIRQQLIKLVLFLGKLDPEKFLFLRFICSVDTQGGC